MSKKILQAFYKSEAIIHPEILCDYIHPDIMVEWHSSKGLITMNYQDLVDLSTEMSRAYLRSKFAISHMISENNSVAVRYSHFVNTIENPREEMLLAHFMIVWEFKDGKLYRGYQMSQIAG